PAYTTQYYAPYFNPCYNPCYNPCGPRTMMPAVVYNPAVVSTTLGTTTVESMATSTVQTAKAEELTHSPAIRAYWTDEPLLPGQRSTLLGLTSNNPPTYDDVRVQGNPQAVVQAGDTAVRPALLSAFGEVPTPVADVCGVAGTEVATFSGGVGAL